MEQLHQEILGALARGFCHPETSDRVMDPALCEAQAKEVMDVVGKYADALIWCSGSGDFQVDGVAYEGWKKVCAPLIQDPTQ